MNNIILLEILNLFMDFITLFINTMKLRVGTQVVPPASDVISRLKNIEVPTRYITDIMNLSEDEEIPSKIIKSMMKYGTLWTMLLAT